MKDKQKNKLARIISDKTDIPVNSLADMPFIEISGKNSVEIVGVKKIIEYNDKSLKLEFKNYQIVFCGENIQIKCFSNNNMEVKGNFENVELN